MRFLPVNIDLWSPLLFGMIVGLAMAAPPSLDEFTGVPTASAAARPRGGRGRAKVVRSVRKPARPHQTAQALLPPLRDGQGRSGSEIPVQVQAPPPTFRAGMTATEIAQMYAQQPVAAPPSMAPSAAAPVRPLPGSTPVPSGKAARAQKPTRSDDDVMAEAQSAYIRGDRAAAIDLAMTVAGKGTPQSPSAWKFIGLAACSVRSGRLATRAYQHVATPAAQQSITAACANNGLTLKDDSFTTD